MGQIRINRLPDFVLHNVPPSTLQYNYSSASFSEGNRCLKCGLFMPLEVRLSKLETRSSSFKVP